MNLATDKIVSWEDAEKAEHCESVVCTDKEEQRNKEGKVEKARIGPDTHKTKPFSKA